MTPRCPTPTHNRPLIPTHGGSLTCLDCRLKARLERSSGWMRTPAEKRAKRKVYNKTAYEGRRARIKQEVEG